MPQALATPNPNALALALFFALASPALAAPAPPSSELVLEAVRQAYADTGPFQETLDVTLRMPDGTTARRHDVYGITVRDEAFFTSSTTGSATLTIVTRSDRALAVWNHLPDRYAETPYHGNLSEALKRLGAAEAGFMVPAAVAAAQGADGAALRESLRFGVLGSWVGAPRVTLRDNSDALYELELEASNGHLTLGIDAKTKRFRTLRVTIGEPPTQIQGEGTFQFQPGPPADPPPWPRLEGRQAVATLPALEASRLQPGDPSPSIDLRLTTGETLALHGTEARVVVLDFWATWCVPCWQGLEQTAELATWVETMNLPVRVLAIDTLEGTPVFDEQRNLVARFLASRTLDLPVALDVGNRAFEAFGSPGLPSLFVIGPDGSIVSRHSGVAPDLADTVKEEVLALVGPG